MQPPRSKHARSLHALTVVVLLVGSMGGGVGCTSAPDPPSGFVPSDTIASAVERDSALALLTSMRRSAFDSAFVRLDRYAFTRSLRTEQLAPAGTVTARRAHVLRYPNGTADGQIQKRESSGTFRDGNVLAWAAPESSPTAPPPNVAQQLLGDDPAYVDPRTREAFRYALRADTRHGRTVYVLEARARTGDPGRDQSVRYARLLIDPASRELIGLTLVRIDDGLLFRERSRFALRLTQLPDGAWVPAESRVYAFLHVPFRAPRHVRTVSVFSDYTDA